MVLFNQHPTFYATVFAVPMHFCDKKTENMLIINKLDESARIMNSSYTQRWLVETLAAKDQLFYSRLKEAQITNISFEDPGGAKGNLSNVYKITIKFSDKEPPYFAAIKIPNDAPLANMTSGVFGTGAPDTNSGIDDLHNRECDFYEKLGNLSVLPLPKIYAIERIRENGREGAVLMEYLTEYGIIKDIFHSLNAEQIENLTKVIAKLIAYSIRLPDEDFDRFKHSKSFAETVIRMNKEIGPQNATMWASDFGDIYKRIDHLFLKPHYTEYSLNSINTELGLRPVFVHGDLWVGNVVWKKDTCGARSDDVCAVIDWQIMHAGNVGQDLAFLLGTSADQEIRRDAEKWVFNLLFNCIEDELRGSGTTNPYTPEVIEAAYRRSFVGYAVEHFSFTATRMSGKESPDDKRTLLRRVKGELEDAIDVLERYLPEWLDPNYVPNFGNK